MKFKTILTMAVVVLCSAACSDEKELPAVADIAGSYEGYTLAGCAYFQNTCVTDETVTVTGNADGTANVTFTSGSWGEFSIPNAQMSESGGTYTLMGSGQTKMGMGGNVSSYDCTYTAVIESREKAQMQFKVSGVMGGLTIDFTTGEVPADLLLAGTWEGYTATRLSPSYLNPQRGAHLRSTKPPLRRTATIIRSRAKGPCRWVWGTM